MSASLEQVDRGAGRAGGTGEFIGQGGASAALALARTIQTQIVPRLVVARALPAQPPSHPGMSPVTAAVAEITTLAIGADGNALRVYIAAALAHQSYEAVCLDLLAPAARSLGEMWNEDLCSFVDVSVGLARLHEAMRLVDRGALDGAADGVRRRKILLAQAPGDQHMFGLSMVASLFGHAGWAVTSMFPGREVDMCAQLQRQWFGLIGISVGAEANLQRVVTMLPRLREASRNRSIAIMVGGPIFTLNPDLARQIGADATAADGVQATWQAENLLTARPGYC